MQKIFLFTNSYPFSRVSEAFLDVELRVAASLNLDINIVPLNSSSFKKRLPAGINLIDNLSKQTAVKKLFIFLQMLISPMFWTLFTERKVYKRPNNLFYAVKYLYGAFLLRSFLLSHKTLFPKNSIFYSFWFNYTVLGFALAKEDSPHFAGCRFFSRAHRYDLYADEVGYYMPYRDKMMGCLERVFSGSEDGVRFLSQQYPEYVEKIGLGRLGVVPSTAVVRNKKTTDLSLISCSNIVPVKRVGLIFSSIRDYCKMNSGVNVSWMHIGDGVGLAGLKKDLENDTPINLNVQMPGVKPSEEISKLFAEYEFDAFINLSSSEGLPVTLMMAISAGIPIIATDAGGNKEITTPQTGFLLPIDFSPEEFSSAIERCMNNYNLRESSFSFFENNFSAVSNYTSFYTRLTGVLPDNQN
jgi:glycosyltransferase involved in cell wall biosynthesis